MATRIYLNEDETFVEGRSQKRAAELLEAAKDQGLSTNVVRTTSNGYIVPKSLVESSDVTAENVEVVPVEGSEADAAEATEADAGAEAKTEEGDLYDPAKHNAEEVKEYFDTADQEERDRLIAAEKSGKARKTLLSKLEGSES